MRDFLRKGDVDVLYLRPFDPEASSIASLPLWRQTADYPSRPFKAFALRAAFW